MSRKTFFRWTLFPAIILLTMTNAARAQDEEDAPPPSRSINSLDFQTQRPATVPARNKASANFKAPVKNQKRRKSIAVLTNPRRKYALVRRNSALKRRSAPAKRSNSKTKTPLKEESLGVTFWRLRPTKAEEREDAPTFPINTGDGTEFWTAERVRSTTRFKVEDRVRFTIESPRDGFLYIVNREIFADGSTGEAMLIYPTLRTRGGDNSVETGNTIDVPTGNENFKIASKRDDYAGEEVIVIVSPTKLPQIKLGSKAIPISDEKLEKWLADWGETVDIYDATDGEGVAITRTENEAAGTRSLVQEEPSPQTIFKTRTRANQPLVVSFQMLAKTPDD